MSNLMNRVIVYGGKGALGQATVFAFKKLNWWVLSIDLERLGHNAEADVKVLIQDENLESWTAQEEQVLKDTKDLLKGEKVQAIICVAGGWVGGSASSGALVKNADMMMKQSVWPSVISARLASLHLDQNGVLVLTGAKPALAGTPGMIGYGLAKAAVHQLVGSLASKNSGMPEGSATLAILPQTLDTPMNRKWMPDANFSEWTPLTFVTGLFTKWAMNEDRPKNGSLVVLDAQKTSIADSKCNH